MATNPYLERTFIILLDCSPHQCRLTTVVMTRACKLNDLPPCQSLNGSSQQTDAHLQSHWAIHGEIHARLENYRSFLQQGLLEACPWRTSSLDARQPQGTVALSCFVLIFTLPHSSLIPTLHHPWKNSRGCPKRAAGERFVDLLFPRALVC